MWTFFMEHSVYTYIYISLTSYNFGKKVLLSHKQYKIQISTVSQKARH